MTVEFLVDIFTTQTVDHQKVVLLYHVTYLVQLFYRGKLSSPENHEYSLVIRSHVRCAVLRCATHSKSEHFNGTVHKCLAQRTSVGTIAIYCY